MWEYNFTNSLYHAGVKGMKWGVQRWKNKDYYKPVNNNNFWNGVKKSATYDWHNDPSEIEYEKRIKDTKKKSIDKITKDITRLRDAGASAYPSFVNGVNNRMNYRQQYASNRLPKYEKSYIEETGDINIDRHSAFAKYSAEREINTKEYQQLFGKTSPDNAIDNMIMLETEKDMIDYWKRKYPEYPYGIHPNWVR